MHEIETDHNKNLLVIRLNGFQSLNRESFVSDIEQAAANLPLGFSCIIILYKYKIFPNKQLQDLEDLLYVYGLKTIVYVGGHHHSFFRHKASLKQTDIRIVQATTLEEAENVLSIKTES